MKYLYKCPECGDTQTHVYPAVEHTGKERVYCYDDNNKQRHKTRLMERVYSPTQLKFIGDGFTGAAGTIPHMTKEKRKEDLVKPIEADLNLN